MPGQSSATWIDNSRFPDGPSRIKAAHHVLDALFRERSEQTPTTDTAPLPSATLDIVNLLTEPLRANPPNASQAAEAALTLAAFSLAEQRVLDISSAESGDLNENSRIAGDRTVGDRLCSHQLQRRNIPATRGPLQSSSFRAGYLAPQVRNASLRQFVAWQSDPDCTIDDIGDLAAALVDAFLQCASSLPPLPTLVAARFTFVAYREARDALLAEGSGGAFEQYLLAGLLHEELSASATGLRATTKNVGANDAASGAAGDIEIRQGHALRAAIEVTAARWDDKLDQLPVVAAARLSEATIAAPDVTTAVSGEELAQTVGPIANRLGLDVAVVDLHALMDVAAARISRAGRAESFRFTYDCLARYHRRQPQLAGRLVDVLTKLGLVSGSESPPPQTTPSGDVNDVVARVRMALGTDELMADPRTPLALRELASSLESDQLDDESDD